MTNGHQHDINVLIWTTATYALTGKIAATFCPLNEYVKMGHNQVNGIIKNAILSR